VSLALSVDELLIEVQDDGVGFDPDERNGGFGLAGMRERVYLAGGTLDIHRAYPGTLLFVRMPVRQPLVTPQLLAANQSAT